MNQRALPSASLAAQPQWELRQIVDELRAVRERWRDGLLRHQECGAREFASRQHLRDIVTPCARPCFPCVWGRWTCSRRVRIFLSAIRSTRP